MADFNEAIKLVLQQEGGYVDSKYDRGGATKYGISLSFLKSLGVFGDMDKDGDIDVADIKRLEIEDAKKLYKRHFWKNLGDISSQRIANYIFSIAVNTGNRRGALLLQTTLNRYTNCQKVRVDGIIGIKTINAINNISNIPLFLSLLTLHVVDFYRSIANKNTDQSIFLLGWLNRAFDCLEEI